MWLLGTCPHAHSQGSKQVLLQTGLVGKLGPFMQAKATHVGHQFPLLVTMGNCSAVPEKEGGLQLVHQEQKGWHAALVFKPD